MIGLADYNRNVVAFLKQCSLLPTNLDHCLNPHPVA